MSYLDNQGAAARRKTWIDDSKHLTMSCTLLQEKSTFNMLSIGLCFIIFILLLIKNVILTQYEREFEGKVNSK